MKVSRQAGLQSFFGSRYSRSAFRLFATILAVTSLLPVAGLVAGCNFSASAPRGAQFARSPGSSSADGKTVESEEVYLKAIEQLAFATDTTNVDGWVAGTYSRVFKSDYLVVIPTVKAKFAVDYQKMLDKSGQNLAVDLKTYVPYSKREAFARQWWSKSEYAKDFKAEPVKKQIAWCYESLWDGSELFWRVFEARHPNQVNSAAVMAHDKEQQMVHEYMEDEKTPGSFSKRYAVWKQLARSSGEAKQDFEKENGETAKKEYPSP